MTQTKEEQIEKTQHIYNDLLKKINALCTEAEQELQQIKRAG